MPKEAADSGDGDFTLTLDDETQHRCAGYLQAEIERFVELLEDDATHTEPKPATDDEQASADEEDERSKSKSKETGKAAQGKKSQKKEGESRDARGKLFVANPVLVDTESRSWLEREYLFIDVISTFLRAVRAGAINIQHGSVLLAHYGRLGVAFDTCVKVVVDILREEGLAGGNGEIIVAVVTKAVQEVRQCLLPFHVD